MPLRNMKIGVGTFGEIGRHEDDVVTDHSKLVHYPRREWVWRDGEEVVICRPLCGSNEELQIAGNRDSVVTCKECRSLARRMRHAVIVG